MLTHKENPRPAATGTRVQSQSIRSNSKRLLPYSKTLKPSKRRTVWVCIGSDAWGRGASLTWFPGEKVVLPPGDHPSQFRWSFVADFADAAIITDGEQPTAETVTALAREILVYVDSLLFLPVDRHTVKFNAPCRRAA